MKATKSSRAVTSRIRESAIARTVRFPRRLREQILSDAERCTRSFEAQVIALLRRHYGDDVDIAPAPDAIIGLARASFVDMPEAEQRIISRRVVEDDQA